MNEVAVSRAEFAELSGEILGRGEFIRFRARGSSMYPFLRNGDVVTVKGVDPENIDVWDICMFLRPESQPVVHRIIGKVISGDGIIFRVQGDMLFGQAEIVRADRVLGKAVAFTRNGRTVQLDTRFHRAAASLWYKIRVVMWLVFELKRVFRGLVLRALEGIQAHSLYRRMARKLMGRWMSCRPLVSDDAGKLSRIYRMDENPGKTLESLEKHELIAGVLLGSRLVGAITLSLLDEERWPGGDMLLSGLYVRYPFRGMGFGERLVKEALDKADQQGAKRVMCFVFEDNQPALRFYRKMGFQPPAGETKQAEGNRRRIVLSREVRPGDMCVTEAVCRERRYGFAS